MARLTETQKWVEEQKMMEGARALLALRCGGGREGKSRER